jgi:hypothetical protein
MSVKSNVTFINGISKVIKSNVFVIIVIMSIKQTYEKNCWKGICNKFNESSTLGVFLSGWYKKPAFGQDDRAGERERS